MAACCALIVALSLLLWNATGRAGFTRFRDETRAAREQAAGSVADLFEDTGLGGDRGVRVEDVPNSFAFGLLPSTYPWRVWDVHLASVVTIAGPAALTALVGFVMSRRRNEPRP